MGYCFTKYTWFLEGVIEEIFEGEERWWENGCGDEVEECFATGFEGGPGKFWEEYLHAFQGGGDTAIEH